MATGLRDITKENIESAIGEFDRMGRERFLAHYNFHKAREYWLVFEKGKYAIYDSKAIVGVARKYAHPKLGPLRATKNDFVGGESQVAPLLRRIGFRVERGSEADVRAKHTPRLPTITDHYVAYHNEDTWGPWNGYGSFYTAKAFKPETLVGNRLWGVLGSGSPRTYRIATSGIITSLSDWERPTKWRTKERPSGKQIIFENDLAAPIDVTSEPWFKTLARQQANFSHGLNRITDSDVIASLKGLLNTGAQTTYAEELPGGLEGAVKQVFVNRYERDERARARCIEHYGPACSVCGLDFERVYGVIGRGYIHVHHRKPLSEIGKRYKVDPIKDLVPVCPNCHAMLHQPPGVRSIEHLKSIIEATPGKKAPSPRPSPRKTGRGGLKR